MRHADCSNDQRSPSRFPNATLAAEETVEEIIVEGQYLSIDKLDAVKRPRRSSTSPCLRSSPRRRFAIRPSRTSAMSCATRRAWRSVRARVTATRSSSASIQTTSADFFIDACATTSSTCPSLLQRAADRDPARRQRPAVRARGRRRRGEPGPEDRRPAELLHHRQRGPRHLRRLLGNRGHQSRGQRSRCGSAECPSSEP